MRRLDRVLIRLRAGSPPARAWDTPQRQQRGGALAVAFLVTTRPRALVYLVPALLLAFGCTTQTTLSGDPDRSPAVALQFDGSQTNYVEIPSSPDFSVGDTGLTVAVWVRPDTFEFTNTEPVGGDPQCQYVHWLGKGEYQDADQEWTFRMYRDDATACSGSSPNRSKRISFYVFAPTGGRGCGSYFQDDIQPGSWVHVVGVVDPNTQTVAIYKNGNFRHRDSYASLQLGPGQAPLRLGTRDAVNRVGTVYSLFQGGLAQVQIWNVPLDGDQINALYNSGTVPDGLVAQYSLDQGSGNTVSDSADSHADGTIFGGTWDFGSYPIDMTPNGTSGGGC